MSEADDSDRRFHNPLDDLVSFPESVVAHRQNLLPGESSGWGLHLLLGLPRLIVQASLDTQLSTAGFAAETSAGDQQGLLRFIRSDAYVWGMVTEGPGQTTSVLLSYTPGGEADGRA